MVEFFNPVTNEPISYHLDKRMIFVLNQIKEMITKKDNDCVMVVDGSEGVGKSTFSQQVGKFVDPSLDLPRICMTSDEFKQAIINANKRECVIYDEAVTGMTAGDSITRIGKVLKSMMMQMRQKNLFVILIIPSLFELNRYTILSRTACFFHIYESKGKRGYFVGYNKKDIKNLYFRGKKSYSYNVRSRFIGRFHGKYVVDEQQYRKKKEHALFMIDNVPTHKEEMAKKYIIQRNNLLYIMNKQGFSMRKIQNLIKPLNFGLTDSTIQEIIADIRKTDRSLTANNKENKEIIGVPTE